MVGGGEDRAEGGAGGEGCVCTGAAWGPTACVKTFRRGKTGCDCDCGAGRGARGESRRLPNGGVGIFGGVTDRLCVAVKVEAEAYGVEAMGRLSVFAFFDGARLFKRPFLGGRGGAESAGSISIVMGGDVGIFVFTVTIGGVEAVSAGSEWHSPAGSTESVSIGVSFSTTAPEGSGAEGATGIGHEVDDDAGAVTGGELGAGAGAIGTGVGIFFFTRGFSVWFGWTGGNLGGGTADPTIGTPGGTSGGMVFIAIASATIRGSGMIPFSAASRAASTARPFLLRPSRSRFFFGPAKGGRQLE